MQPGFNFQVQQRPGSDASKVQSKVGGVQLVKVQYREGLAIHLVPRVMRRVLSREIDPTTSGCLRYEDRRGATSRERRVRPLFSMLFESCDVMARPLRLEYEGALYHGTSRGNAREDIFLDDKDWARFLEILGDVVVRYGWICHGYCLMSNHYHLLIERPEANLSRGIQLLNGVYTQWFNR